MFKEKSGFFADVKPKVRRTQTLDGLLAEHNLSHGSFDLIKLDVQGAELGTLRGGLRALAGACLPEFHRGVLRNCWYLGLSDNAYTDAGVGALADAMRGKMPADEGESGGGAETGAAADAEPRVALPKLEFLTASAPHASAESIQALQAVLTARRQGSKAS